MSSIGGAEFIVLIMLIAVIPAIISMWVLFQKAGEPGWASIVPIYNCLVMLKIINKPWYWVLLMIIPYLGVVWGIWSLNLFVKAFGKNEGFTIGCIFLPFIFLPMLAVTGKYQGQQSSFGHPEVLDRGI